MTPQQFQSLYVSNFLKQVAQFKPQGRLVIEGGPWDQGPVYVTQMLAENLLGNYRLYDLTVSPTHDGNLSIRVTAAAQGCPSTNSVYAGDPSCFHILAGQLALDAFQHLHSAL